MESKTHTVGKRRKAGMMDMGLRTRYKEKALKKGRWRSVPRIHCSMGREATCWMSEKITKPQELIRISYCAEAHAANIQIAPIVAWEYMV